MVGTGHSPTPAPPRVVGPLLVYTSQVPAVRELALAVYDVGTHRELHRSTLPDDASVTFSRSDAGAVVATASGGMTEVRRINLIDASSRHLATVASDLPDATVSPGGTMLAYSRHAPGMQGARDIVARKLGGGDERVLAWLPDISEAFRGPAHVFGWRDDQRGVLIGGAPGGPAGTWADVMLDGSIAGPLQDYGWPAPSGRAVVTDDGTDTGCISSPVQRLRIWDFDAGSYTAEVDDPGAGIVVDQWSPDGGALLYMQYQTKRPAGACLPDYDASTGRAFLLSVRGGAPTPVADVAALRRTWNHGHDLTHSCADGSAPSVWDTCGQVDTVLAVDGHRVDGPGSGIRVLGWIDLTNSEAATPTP